MRQLLHRHRWATLAVTMLLLFATSGMALSRMTCLIGGHSVWALGQIDDCCPEDERPEGPAISPVCCVYGQAGGEVLPFVPAPEMVFTPVWACFIPQVFDPGTRQAPGSCGEAFTRPPPTSGTERLVAHRLFRI